MVEASFCACPPGSGSPAACSRSGLYCAASAPHRLPLHTLLSQKREERELHQIKCAPDPYAYPEAHHVGLLCLLACVVVGRGTRSSLHMLQQLFGARRASQQEDDPGLSWRSEEINHGRGGPGYANDGR